MRKTQQSIKRAIDAYMDIVRQEYPGLEFDAQMNPEAGVDAWLWIQLNHSNQHLRDAIESFTSKLTARLSSDENDLYIVAIPHMKEPVHG